MKQKINLLFKTFCEFHWFQIVLTTLAFCNWCLPRDTCQDYLQHWNDLDDNLAMKIDTCRMQKLFSKFELGCILLQNIHKKSKLF
jgi:hypothetical protein